MEREGITNCDRKKKSNSRRFGGSVVEAENWKFYRRRLIDGLCVICREILRPCPILITQVGGTVMGRQVCRLAWGGGGEGGMHLLQPSLLHPCSASHHNSAGKRDHIYQIS